VSRTDQRGPFAILRGLALGLSLSLLNLLGVTLTLVALGGFGEWTGTQFVGLFGIIEIATGAAFIIGPNVWHLPVAASRLPRGSREVRFAASTVFIPHWAAGVKCIAGAVLCTWVFFAEGAAFASIGLVVVAAGLCASSVALSMVFARMGSARPDIDVFEVVIKRPERSDIALPGMSLGASFVQTLLNVVTFPAVQLLTPGALFQPEFAPSRRLLVWVTGVSVLFSLLAVAAWWGRITWRAPKRQQAEAEDTFASA